MSPTKAFIKAWKLNMATKKLKPGLKACYFSWGPLGIAPLLNFIISYKVSTDCRHNNMKVRTELHYQDNRRWISIIFPCSPYILCAGQFGEFCGDKTCFLILDAFQYSCSNLEVNPFSASCPAYLDPQICFHESMKAKHGDWKNKTYLRSISYRLTTLSKPGLAEVL